MLIFYNLILYKESDIITINDVKEAYTILNNMKNKKDVYALFDIKKVI